MNGGYTRYSACGHSPWLGTAGENPARSSFLKEQQMIALALSFAAGFVAALALAAILAYRAMEPHA